MGDEAEARAGPDESIELFNRSRFAGVDRDDSSWAEAAITVHPATEWRTTAPGHRQSRRRRQPERLIPARARRQVSARA